MTIKTLIAVITLCVSAVTASGQMPYYLKFQQEARARERADSIERRVRQMIDNPDAINDTLMVIAPLSRAMFMPAVWTSFRYGEDRPVFEPDLGDNPAMRWVEVAAARERNENGLLQRFMLANMPMVRYNLASLPEAPKKYIAKVDPKKYTIEIQEVLPETPDKLEVDIQRRHWIRSFSSTLQFSQGYVSPNWYQGGTNALNLLADIYYNVKLNPAFHPNLLFESTFQYKLGINNAPDDSLRNYSVTEDLLQINSTFGYKAARRWYYSVSAQFRTQVLNSYVKNKRQLASALLSPAELNVGLGMTYNYTNKKKTFTFDASISPLSYTMKICAKPDSLLNHGTYGIDADKHTASKYGSSAECKIRWQMCRNILLHSRIYAFTDYGYIQADWENTLSMDINRYLSTQIYAHLRYDTTTPHVDGWHKLQVKEILSFGVTYKFSSL